VYGQTKSLQQNELAVVVYNFTDLPTYNPQFCYKYDRKLKGYKPLNLLMGMINLEF